MNNYHESVLLQEVLEALKVKPEKRYIDATLGGGGHTVSIIERGGLVLGIDVDEEALTYVEKEIKSQKSKVKNKELLVIARGNFGNIAEIARKHGFEKVDGIVLDLGVSSHQIDTPERGFSFQAGPLDMRMDSNLSVKAQDLVNGLTEKELVELFVRLGEERFAKKIAKVIVERRESGLIETTGELAGLIKASVYRSNYDIHPATRIFQALRIAVNDELNNLRVALPQAVSLLKDGGRLVVISFHSLEDRIVKQSFLGFEDKGLGEIMTKKPIIPGEDEITQNRRARSAKLRVFQAIRQAQA